MLPKVGYDQMPKGRRHNGVFASLLICLVFAPSVSLAQTTFDNSLPPKQVAEDPLTGWGSDHVGKSLPPYVTGDECLFCHRDIGPDWGTNPHQLSMRMAAENDLVLNAIGKQPHPADTPIYLLGQRRKVFFLRRGQAYGKLDLLSTALKAANNKPQYTVELHPTTIRDEEGIHPTPHWQKNFFADKCVGCHATGVETESRAFSAISLDCYVCHGDVPLGHTNDVSQVFLSSQNADAKQVASICGQCHLRGGSSRSTGLPYPNTFVAGDNLLKDFQTDLSTRNIESLQPVDQHVFANIRSILLENATDSNCLTCHDVHAHSSQKHQELDYAAGCATCHADESDLTLLTAAWLTVVNKQDSSPTCGY